MSVTFFYYSTTFRGTSFDMDEQALFESMAQRAEDQLKRYERIYTVTEPEANARNNAICAMAEVIHSIDLILSGEGGNISSARIGSVSVSRGNIIGSQGGVDISEKGQNKALYNAACRHLNIYRGVS